MRNLKPVELKALHECLTWCRSGTNNKTLQMYATSFENFHHAAGKLMDKIRTVLPEGSTKCRIRLSKRESHTPSVSTLLETLGEESQGMVFLDPTGIPMKYDMLQIYKDAIGTASCRIAVDAQYKNTWKKTGLVIDTAKDPSFDESWKRDISKGADHLLETSYITASDHHLDAKLWPNMHPYGTGSLLSEGEGCMQRLIKNRLLLIQNCFRQSNLYAFWYLNRLITKELFFRNFMGRNRGVANASDADAADPLTRLYGTVMPSDIPESTAWWRNQQKELFALSDDSENGLMQTMLTVTANDNSPELAACVRRGQTTDKT